MKRKWMYCLGILMAAFVFITAGPTQAQAATSDDTVVIEATCLYDYALEELELMNEERADAGADDLTMDASLQEAAMERAAELALNFSHTRPDGTTCFTISSAACAENIAAGYSTASAVTTGWMNSSGHKENMLNSSYVSVGVGCAKVGSITFWVQLFGTGSASGTIPTGTATQTYTIAVSYSTVTYDGSGFNLNMAQEDPEPLTVGDTYELSVGILNAGWSGTYAHTSGSGYTWTSSDTSVLTVDSSGLVTALGAGDATITAVSAGGYTWSKDFEVSAFSLSDATISLSYTSCTYNGSARKPSVTVKYSGSTLTKGTDYTVTYKNNTSAGTASVVITGKGSYEGSVTKTFTIKSKSLTSSSAASELTLSYTSCTYNGSARKPGTTLKITLNGSEKTLKKGTDYTVTYSSNTDAGTATVKVTGTGNYSGTLKETFTINKKNISSSASAAKVTLSTSSYTYSGKAKKPSVTLKITLNSKTTKLTKGTDYTVSYSDNKSIGKATVTIKGTGNYKGTVKKTFTIKPKQASVSSAKSSSSGKIKVTWSKVSGSVTKYQIRYRYKTSSGYSSWKKKTVSASSLSKTLTGLKSGKTYQIQVRAYKTVDGKNYCGAWSDTVKAKCK